jgi:hypothetical protein
MKLNRLMTMCAMTAAMLLTVGSAFAQQDNNNNATQDNGGQRRNRQGGGGGGGGGGGNFDPAQMQQRIMDRIRTDLNFTNETDWSAVQPLVQKVVEARFASRAGGFGRGNRGPGGGGGGQPAPERDALQNAIDANAPAAQVKDLLAKYKASQKEKQAKFVAAQDELRKVLTIQQEAQLTLGGWLE